MRHRMFGASSKHSQRWWRVNEWMNENLYIAHNKLPHKTLRVHEVENTPGRIYVRMYLWWSACTSYLLACHVRVIVGDSSLCCCLGVACCQRWLTPLFVDCNNAPLTDHTLTTVTVQKQGAIKNACVLQGPGSGNISVARPAAAARSVTTQALQNGWRHRASSF